MLAPQGHHQLHMPLDQSPPPLEARVLQSPQPPPLVLSLSNTWTSPILQKLQMMVWWWWQYPTHRLPFSSHDPGSLPHSQWPAYKVTRLLRPMAPSSQSLSSPLHKVLASTHHSTNKSQHLPLTIHWSWCWGYQSEYSPSLQGAYGQGIIGKVK